MQDIPQGYRYAMGVAAGPKLYMFGGYDNDDRTAVVNVCDAIVNQWIKVEGMPKVRSSGVVVNTTNAIFAIGGMPMAEVFGRGYEIVYYFIY